jgi:hypothetical protein
MKTIAAALLVADPLIGTMAEANAVTCARGVYRAGCVGPHGAVTTHRGYGYHGAAVVRPAPYSATGAPACASAAGRAG